MPRAWRLSARPSRRRFSTPWSFSASSAWFGASATRWPVSAKPRAIFLSNSLESLRRYQRQILRSDAAGLLFSKNFGVGGLGGRGCGGDVQHRIERQCDWWQAKFVAAGLVAKLQRNALFAERSACKRGDGQPKNHSVLVNVQRNFRKGEFFKFALGIGNLAAAEAGGKRGLEIGGDEVVLRFFAGIDVEARANLHHNRNLKRTSASYGIE